MSWLEVVKTIAMIFSHSIVVAVVGAAMAAWVAAHVGMRIWRKQMLAKEEYELTRKLLWAVFCIRRAISLGRCADTVHENKEDMLDRMKKIVKVYSDFETEILEAEIIWGRLESMRYSLAFMECCEVYLSSLWHSISNGSGGIPKVPIYGPFNDEFGKRLDASVEQMQEWLKPKLELSHRVAWWRRKR